MMVLKWSAKLKTPKNAFCPPFFFLWSNSALQSVGVKGFKNTQSDWISSIRLKKNSQSAGQREAN